MDILDKLSAKLSAGAVVTDLADMAPYLTDWRGRYTGSARAVLRPANTAEVATIMEACFGARVPVVPQGGNTSLCGGATPSAAGNAVVLSLSRMKRIRHVDVRDNTLIVDAGVTLQEAAAAASAVDRLFPLSLASEGSCQIGGNLSTNAGGVHVMRYGSMRDLVLGLEVVLPDGRVFDGLRQLHKDNTGYDLKQLFIGAEGTLGVITGAVLKLFPRPQSRALAWLGVTSVAVAIELLSRLKSLLGERIAAFELMGELPLQWVLRHLPNSRPPLQQAAPWHVLIELTDTLPEVDLAGALAGVVAPLLESGEVIDSALAQSPAQIAAFWALRDNMSEAQKREGLSIKHDISLPVSAVGQFIEHADAALATHFPGVRIVTFGHLGDGNLHYNVSHPHDNGTLMTRSAEVNRLVHDLVHALEGSIAAEHGLGQLKREEIRRYKSPLEMELMRTLKHAIDGRGIMNPGKVL